MSSEDKVSLFESALTEVLKDYGVLEPFNREFVDEDGVREVIYHVVTPNWSIARENVIFREVYVRMQDFCRDNGLEDVMGESYIFFD